MPKASAGRFTQPISEAAVRKKYHFDESTWESLGKDDALVERIEAEKLQRIRNGSAKREKAQQLIVKGPEILDGIMSDSKASPKHKVDAIKTLDALAANGPRAAEEQDRVVITINLGGDEKLVVDTLVKPIPPNTDGKIIDATPSPIHTVDEPPPMRRGPGRPPGSRNKPKLDQQELLPGFLTE